MNPHLRFISGILDAKECWQWNKGLSPKGYGTSWYNGETCRANRLSWKLFVGDIPEGMQVCHKCDNPRCVNPHHLFLGTNQDNVDDKMAKGRYVKKWKLSSQERLEIQKQKGLAKVKDLAQRYGVSRHTITNIQKNKFSINEVGEKFERQ